MKKKGIKAWLASLHPVLKELLAGIVLTGILFEAVFVWLAKDRLYFSAGLWLGIAVSIFRICHLYHGIVKSMEMSEKQAKGYAAGMSSFRFAVTIGALVLIYLLHLGDVVGAFLGLLAVKPAVYLRPVVCRILGHQTEDTSSEES